LSEPLALVIACAATVLVATLSYRVVERPFLRLKRRFASEVRAKDAVPYTSASEPEPAPVITRS
jgi:peptidoglycan/LPS O-acetylase OafA/YrhL